MDNVTRLLMQGAAGAAGGGLYVDDVFSTYLYKGIATARTITNGIDLAGEGGLVWTKSRTTATAQNLIDTVRGKTQRVRASSNSGSTNITDAISAFNDNGYGLAAETQGYGFNLNNVDYTSWTFRKAKGFFDVVTYTGTGSARTVSHNLGSVPGCIMVKRTDGGSEDWVVYHRGMSDKLGNNPGHYYLYLNDQNGYMGGASRFNNTAATSTEFTVGTDNGTNGNGFSYVAYVFANGGESGSYGGTASGTVTAYVKGDTTMTSSGVSMTTGPFGASNTAVNFSNNFNALEQPATWQTGTSNYTIECWFKAGSTAWSQNWSMLISRWVSNSSIYLGLRPSGQMHFINYNQSLSLIHI